eukprot:gene38471-51974_t
MTGGKVVEVDERNFFVESAESVGLFADHGDSGSLVFHANGTIVGMVTGKSKFPGIRAEVLGVWNFHVHLTDWYFRFLIFFEFNETLSTLPGGMNGTATSTSDQRQMELFQLQKEYRHMEINRRAYAEESNSILRKQQSTIDKLRKDNESLKNEIAMIMRSSSKPISQLQQDVIQSLTEQGDKYATNIEIERKNITLMEEQVVIMRGKILNQRRAMGGVNASKENFYMIEKQIRILENRLDKSLIKFNEAITHNKVLRDEIDEV